MAPFDRATSRRSGLARAVFALDRRLQRRQSVYEYCDDPQCLFRAQRARAERDIELSDGTFVREGDAIVRLHLWNEHIPAIDRHGPSIAWARDVNRRIGPSLGALERHLDMQPDGVAVVAICGEMSLGTAERSDQLVRLASRYGFESVAEEAGARSPGAIRRLGENMLMLLLVLAANPASARLSVLRRRRRLLCLSRAALQEHGRARGGAAAGAGAA